MKEEKSQRGLSDLSRLAKKCSGLFPSYLSSSHHLTSPPLSSTVSSPQKIGQTCKNEEPESLDDGGCGCCPVITMPCVNFFHSPSFNSEGGCVGGEVGVNIVKSHQLQLGPTERRMYGALYIHIYRYIFINPYPILTGRWSILQVRYTHTSALPVANKPPVNIAHVHFNPQPSLFQPLT